MSRQEAGATRHSPPTEFRKLPGVDTFLRLADAQPLIERHGTAAVTEAVREALDAARERITRGGSAPDMPHWIPAVRARLAARSQPSLRPVINATGVIIHTNLGRAPLSSQARAALQEMTTGYNTLEYDLDEGVRGSRHSHPRERLCELTGAEDALVVNNNASAVYLVLAALCRERQVVISRGELVEIGGGFRIPDVLRQSGAHLVEVGTTNRTHARDFADAMGPDTAALMRVHTSNFRQLGFVTKPTLAELVSIAHQRQSGSEQWPLVIDDLGSGTLLDTAPYGLAPEPTVQESVTAGADLVTFSGDKLLGGPQAGVIVGRSQWIEHLRRHPMARALRVDKMVLAALDATLDSYRRGRAPDEVPVWQMIAASATSLQTRAETWRDQLRRADRPATVHRGESTVGGGSLPGETLPTTLLALELPRPDLISARLRQATPPVICRIQQDRLLFDPRTVLPEQDQTLLAILHELRTEA